MISILLFATGVFCYAIKELQSHGKLKGQKLDDSFWGEKSWTRKWKTNTGKQLKNIIVIHTDEERFPLSSTALVWLTDGYHLMQFFFIKLFVLSVILYVPTYSWWIDGAIYLGTWYGTFNLVYQTLQRK